MTSTSGPSALLWIRQRGRLTQRELAARSGVSERTIRGLERGQIQTPHPASLEALAKAVGLDERDTKAFLRAWRPDRERSFAELTRHYAPIEDLEAELTLQTSVDQHVIAGWTHIHVLESNVRRLRARSLVQADRDGVDTYTLPYLYDLGEEQPRLDARVLGATIRDEHHFPDNGLIIYEFAYPRALARGETALLTFEWTLHGNPPAGYAKDTESYFALQKIPTPCAVVAVTFEGTRPTTVWQVEMFSDGVQRRVATVTPDEDGTIRQVLRYRPPGSYGFEWPYPLGR